MFELLHRYKPYLVFVSETNTRFASTNKLWDRETYVVLVVEEAQGHSLGVLALQKINLGFRITV